MAHKLSERELFILKILVKEYCRCKKPISSAHLKERYNLDHSSATLRGVFARLEDEGYLFKEHSASGRIPTDLAFRTYVDHLLVLNKYIEIELENLKTELSDKITDVDNIMVAASKMISKFTSEMSFSLGITINSQIIKSIHLSKIAKNQILALIFLSSGIVMDKIFFVMEFDPDKKLLRMIENFINEFAGGKTLPEMEMSFKTELDSLKGELLQYQELINSVLGKLSIVISEFQKVHIEPITGAALDLGSPAVSENIKSLVFKLSEISTPNVLIGNETGNAQFKDISIITAPVKIHEDVLGLLGILGPKAMYYEYNIDFLSHFSDLISRILSDKFKQWR